ncbi:hypothetical protein J6590_067625 [Homalodisca vitripennis]|nr:hypothetical protein J6590_067625 [Homalodisca vitripennis]
MREGSDAVRRRARRGGKGSRFTRPHALPLEGGIMLAIIWKSDHDPRSNALKVFGATRKLAHKHCENDETRYRDLAPRMGISGRV